MVELDAAAVRVRVSGRVQGVFFRQSTKDVAVSLSLTGWVRNEDDGSVLLEAWGSKEKLESLVNWCRHGPSSAKVIDISIEWISKQCDVKGFRITG